MFEGQATHNKSAPWTNDGISVTKDFLGAEEHQQLKNTFFREYETNTISLSLADTFLGEEWFLDYLRRTLNEETLTYVSKSDARQAWLRYYDEDVYNPYKRWHLDMKRYHGGARQYRVAYCIGDTSDAAFYAKLRSRDFDAVRIQGGENSLMIIEAENAKHRVEFSTGKRLMLMGDFTTDLRRGVHGRLMLVWDTVWLHTQKAITRKSRSR